MYFISYMVYVNVYVATDLLNFMPCMLYSIYYMVTCCIYIYIYKAHYVLEIMYCI